MNELAASTIPFLQTLADHRMDAVTWIFNKLTFLGDEKLFVLIALIVFWCVSKRGGQYMLTVGFSASSIGQTLKMLFRVPRPWALGDHPFEGADPVARGSAGGATVEKKGLDKLLSKFLGTGADGWSFPSGHTLISVGTYGAMAAWFKQTWVRIVGIVLAILIPFTRLYLGVHTPVDIVAGAIIALILLLTLRPVFTGDNLGKIRIVLIGNIALTAILMIWMYLAKPSNLAGEDIAHYTSGIKNLWQLVGATLAVWISFEADERRIHFETKAVWWAQVLKVIGGAVIMLGLQTVIQKVFHYSSDTLTLENMTKMGVIACFANLIALTTAMTAWPMTFKWFAKLGRKAE